MSNPGTFTSLAQGVQKWGVAHWTYILVAIAFNLAGVFLRV